MSSKKNKSLVPKKEESQNDIYRKNKKINKSKIKSGQMSKNFLNEDSLLNVLPSGAFDKKIIKEEEPIKKMDDKKLLNDTLNETLNETLNDDINDDIEEEEFNESYFDQVPYTKK